MDLDHHSICNNLGEIINEPRSINIGNHVWIGSKTTIGKGVTIANDVVVASNSLVNKDITESNVVYAGIPAKCVKAEVCWKG